MKKVTVKISAKLCSQIRKDISRDHPFAYERVAFVIGKSKLLSENNELIILTEFVTVNDKDYIQDNSVGARINSNAIRDAMQIAMDKKCSIFHVHAHFGRGTPTFSETDLNELPDIAQSMVNANPDSIHGVLLLSEDGANAIVKMKSSKGKAILEKVLIVGYPMMFNKSYYENVSFDIERYDRQSFLGEWSQHIFSKVKVAVIGLGGGGSHIIQQLAHLGVLNYVIFDSDIIENSNLNRLVGGTEVDGKIKTKKTDVAYRQIISLQPEANVILVENIWQNKTELLQSCDVAFGAVDSFAARRDIELECRRYLIPLIDIGMDVHTIEPAPPRLFGQVILSMPGKVCMQCLGFLTEDILAKEAGKYGDAGKIPQVIWSNGVVASNAIGIFVDMVTGWSRQKELSFYQEYDGNNITLIRSYRLDFLDDDICSHFPLKEAGPIVWNKKNR